MILQVKMLDVEVLGCHGYMWSAVVRPVKLSKTTFGVAYGRELNITFSGNSSGVTTAHFSGLL